MNYCVYGTPTGKTRYRTGCEGWFKKPVLILQIEVVREDGPPDFNGMPIYLGGTFWRDARVEDMPLKETP